MSGRKRPMNKKSGASSELLSIDGLHGPFAGLRGRIEVEAAQEGLAPLTSTHWAVMQFVLDYFLEHQDAPAAVRIGRATGLTARGLRDLFPAGAALTTFRMAGMELPDARPTVHQPRYWN